MALSAAVAQRHIEHWTRVFCRTGLERRTLLHLLGDDAARVRPLLASEPAYCSLFQRDGLYLKRAEFRGRLPSS